MRCWAWVGRGSKGEGGGSSGDAECWPRRRSKARHELPLLHAAPVPSLAPPAPNPTRGWGGDKATLSPLSPHRPRACRRRHRHPHRQSLPLPPTQTPTQSASPPPPPTHTCHVAVLQQLRQPAPLDLGMYGGQGMQVICVYVFVCVLLCANGCACMCVRGCTQPCPSEPKHRADRKGGTTEWHITPLPPPPSLHVDAEHPRGRGRHSAPPPPSFPHTRCAGPPPQKKQKQDPPATP